MTTERKFGLRIEPLFIFLSVCAFPYIEKEVIQLSFEDMAMIFFKGLLPTGQLISLFGRISGKNFDFYGEVALLCQQSIQFLNSTEG